VELVFCLGDTDWRWSDDGDSLVLPFDAREKLVFQDSGFTGLDEGEVQEEPNPKL